LEKAVKKTGKSLIRGAAVFTIIIFLILGIYFVHLRAGMHGIERKVKSFHEFILNTQLREQTKLSEERRRDFLILTRKLRTDFERQITNKEALLSVLSKKIAEIYYLHSRIVKNFRLKNSLINHWLSSEFKGKLNGRIDGRAVGYMDGGLNGKLNAALQGRLTGSIKGRVKGMLTSNFKGTIDGKPMNGPLNGLVDSDLKGYLKGTLGTSGGDDSASSTDTWTQGEFKGSFKGKLRNWVNASFNGSINGFLFASIQGKIKGTLNERFQQIQLLLEGLYETTPGLIWIYFVSEEGFFVIFPKSAYFMGDFDPRQQAWFHSGKNKKSDEVIFEEIDRNQWGGNQLLLRFSRPIRNFDGRFIGFLGIDMDLEAFYREMKNRLVSTGCDPFLIEPSKSIIVPNDLHEKWAFLLVDDKAEKKLQSDPWEKLIQGVLRGEGEDTDLTMHGKKSYLSLYPLAKTGIVLGMTMPVRDIEGTGIQKKIARDIASLKAMVKSLRRSGSLLVLFLSITALLWLGILVFTLTGKHPKQL
jgi:hypothetical protein